MKVYYQNDKIEFPSASIALGNFDGVHIGHLKIIEKAKESGKHSGVLIFETHTREEKVITPFKNKLEIFSELGVDFVYVARFDKAFRNMSLKEFLTFLKEIGVSCISVGYDYRCAKNASADAETLKAESVLHGIETFISPMISFGGTEVKSSCIRELIKNGKIKDANNLMVKPFCISGTVVSGYQNGRKMGFPTANIEPCDDALLPCDGVYVGTTEIDGKRYKAVINVGKNPTLDAQKRTVEGHIIGLDKDLYGSCVSFSFFDRIRGEMKFSSLDELRVQISKDKQYALGINM